MKLKHILIGIGALGIAAVLWTIIDVQWWQYSPGSYISSDEHFTSDTALVLGASVLPNGTPSDVLRDRLLVGAKLYRNHNVQRVLLSGDDGAFHVDEVDVMKNFIETQGVPEKDILVDGQGYRTYESCKRAAQVFHLRDVVVVTQGFHMNRALYLCRHFGLSAFGVTSDLETYRKITYFWARDLLASAKAWFDVNIWPPASPVAAHT